MKRARVTVIDNYDSFTFNLVQRLGELGAVVDVVRNDALTVAALVTKRPQRILLSPGPKTPREAGICIEAVRALAGRARILGVCLGHQAIGVAFGARVVRAPAPVHGEASLVRHDGRTIFRGLAQPFAAGRYHSLIVAGERLPGCLEVSARTNDGIIMAMRHRTLPIEGVQFHPESILTPDGYRLLDNFLRGAA